MPAHVDDAHVDDAHVDIAVVGRGLIGSAAARHLAEAGVSIAAIGVGEPADYLSSTGPFGSHYDQGRITRITDPSAVWAELAARSIARYGDIEERSGISFHTPRALAHLSLAAEDLLENGARLGAQARMVSREWLRGETGISFDEELVGTVVFEGAPAGHINPRLLIAAQTALIERTGGALIDASATAITPTKAGFDIQTGQGTIVARQVLLATGAYGAELVGVDLALERRLRTIVCAELGAAPEIPSLIVDDVGHPELEGIYWVPPVEFPDGRTMLKIGGTGVPTILADDDAAIAAWFHQGGSVPEADALKAAVRALLPTATITSWDHKPCVVTGTASNRPYVGFVAPGVAVAVGGNGAAAKSCDEIGRLAASLFSPAGWAKDGLPHQLFEPETL